MHDMCCRPVAVQTTEYKLPRSNWRETTEVMCDRNIPAKLKDKVYKTAITPAMVFGAECWAVRKKQEMKLHTTDVCMLQWARGKTRLDHLRNVDIWKEAHMNDGRIPQREEVEMVWTCSKAR